MTALESIIAGGSVAVAGSRIAAPPIKCRDGFTVSVQASWGHYCQDSAGDRPGYPDTAAALPYTQVECGYPSSRPEPWAEWEQYADGPEDPTGTVYGYVPVEMVRALVAAHGGESR